jgi:ABC-type lipoprotein export system ATPase subunit
MERVSKTYPLPGNEGRVAALAGADLEIASGELCLLQGASGSGKSSLLAVIAGLTRPTAGNVLYDGRKERPPLGEISCSFQEPVFVPELTVLENLLLPASRCRRLEPSLSGEDLLACFGLEEMFDLTPASLSGGEKRRLDLARALLLPARLLLLDEPTSWLDAAWSTRVMEQILGEVRRRGTTLLVASHDRLPAAAWGRTLTMERGTLIDHGNN